MYARDWSISAICDAGSKVVAGVVTSISSFLLIENPGRWYKVERAHSKLADGLYPPLRFPAPLSPANDRGRVLT